MNSREQAESAVDEALKKVASIFTLLKQKVIKDIKDSEREIMITQLVTASDAAPDYKTEQIKSILKNLYYNRVKDNFSIEKYDVAMDCGLKYLELYNAKAEKDKFQIEIDSLLVKMCQKHYELAKHDFTKREHANALNHCKKFLVLYDLNIGKPEAKKKSEIQDMMLAIHQERVKKLQPKQVNHPNVPASIYRSLPITKVVPRTPAPLKVTQSLNTKFSKNRPAVQSWSGAPTTYKPKKK